MAYNSKALVKLIKASVKGRLHWQNDGEREAITHGLWMVVDKKFDTSVRAVLYAAFGREAGSGESLSLQFGSVSDNGPNLFGIFKPDQTTQYGAITNVVLDGAKGSARRIIRIGEDLSAIDNDFAALFETAEVVTGKGARDVLYFGDPATVMIAPIASTNGSWRDVLKGELGAA